MVHRSGIQITALKFTLFPFPPVMCCASAAALLCAPYESPSLCHAWVTCLRMTSLITQYSGHFCHYSPELRSDSSWCVYACTVFISQYVCMYTLNFSMYECILFILQSHKHITKVYKAGNVYVLHYHIVWFYREWVRMQRPSTSLTVCNPNDMNVLRSSASTSYPQVQQRTSTTTTTTTRDEKQYKESSAYGDLNLCCFMVMIPAVVVSVYSTSLIFVLLLIYLIFLFTVCSHVFFQVQY